jgi:hypothetical protein
LIKERLNHHRTTNALLIGKEISIRTVSPRRCWAAIPAYSLPFGGLLFKANSPISTTGVFALVERLPTPASQHVPHPIPGWYVPHVEASFHTGSKDFRGCTLLSSNRNLRPFYSVLFASVSSCICLCTPAPPQGSPVRSILESGMTKGFGPPSKYPAYRLNRCRARLAERSQM